MLCVPKKRIKDQEESTATAKMRYRQQSKVRPDDSTSALVESILPLVLPVARKAVCKRLIVDGSVLCNEQPVTSFDESDLPIENIELKIDDVLVVDRKTIQSDMKADSDFEWPEQDRANTLMQNIPGKGRDMLVVDLVGFNIMIPFGAGFEFTFPLELPGAKGALEVGCGGSIKKGWIRVLVPRLRFWFVSSSRKCYLAFMDKPQLTPNIHINVDKGKGDILNFQLTEDGSLDDVVETVLSRFGPKLKDSTKKNKESKEKTSWAGVAAGKTIARLLQHSMGGKLCKNAPLEVDLSDTIQETIDLAMGKPRPVAAVEADIEILQKELERSKQAERESLDTRDDKSVVGEDVFTNTNERAEDAERDSLDTRDGKSVASEDEINNAKTRELINSEPVSSNMCCGWG